jgi:hypothetical protein
VPSSFALCLDALFLLLFRLPLPRARSLLGLPRFALAAELAHLHRALVAPRFAPHLRSPFCWRARLRDDGPRRAPGDLESSDLLNQGDDTAPDFGAADLEECL